MKIQKSSGEYEKFNRNKIIQACMIAGANVKLASQIAKDVKDEGYSGMSTDEIRMRVYKRLRRYDAELAERYNYRTNIRIRTSENILDYFNSQMITDSLVKETRVNRSFAEKIAKDVEKELSKMKLNYVTAPLIREIINVKLLEKGMESVRARYTRLGMPVYDVRKLLEYGSKDMVQYNPEAVHKRMSDQIAKEYSLLNVLPIDIADSHLTGQIHIHDLNYLPIRPTSFSHDLKFFLQRGLKVDGTGEYTAVSGPAKRPQAAFMHALKVMIAGQTECSREQYIEDFNYILAPYVEGLSYDKIKQVVQMFFYENSQTSVGKGGKAIYSGLVLDTRLPKNLKDDSPVTPGGIVRKSQTYADWVDEAEKIADAIMEVSLEGDYMGKPFRYPRLIIKYDKKTPQPFLEKASQLSLKYGTPYYLKGERSLFGQRRGTIQHVTINLPQVSLLEKDVFNTLENRMKKAFEVMLLKRKLMAKNLSMNLLPFLKQKTYGVRYYNPKRQKYVISYAGLNELAKLESGHDLLTKGGQRYAYKVLKHMMDVLKTLREESGLDIVLTGAPKGVCYTRFAGIDARRFGEKAPVNDPRNPYYSKTHYVNSKRLDEKLDIEGRFVKLVNGRSMTHVRLSSNQMSRQGLAEFIRKKLKRKDISYLSISRAVTVCTKCGYTSCGKYSKCSICKSRWISIHSRDTGHIQNIRVWNDSQKAAFSNDYRYDLEGDGKKIRKREKDIIMKT